MRADDPERRSGGTVRRARRRAVRVAAALAAAWLLAACGPPLGVVEHRVPGNLLSPETAVDCRGAIGEQRLVDGKIPPPGAPVDDFVAQNTTGIRDERGEHEDRIEVMNRADRT
ncbi:MAG: hypothetical protein JXQ29_04460, partial [Planctomycetes bacterium]|nr:hypothetical protein [Planctomycetota bacterium]